MVFLQVHNLSFFSGEGINDKIFDMASSYFLPRLIGSGRANEFLLTGNWLTAEEAMNLGFASRMVPQEEMIDTASTLAKTMSGKNPLGLRMTKEAININIDAADLVKIYSLPKNKTPYLVAHIDTPGGVKELFSGAGMLIIL